MLRYIFVKFLGFLAVFRIQGCFQCLCNTTPSGVIAYHRIHSLDCNRRGPERVNLYEKESLLETRRDCFEH